MVCVLFVPFRPADYTYVSTLADVRRRESFATARARAQAITQAALPDTLWNFETLDGSPYDAADALSLAAFPDMDNRSEDLYTTYLIAALMAATGVDLNDIIGKSSKMPYYYAHQLCSGAACSSFTLGELASIQAQTSGARGTISCATEPTELALPFTQSGGQPPPQQADSVEALLASGSGGPIVFETSGAQEDMAAAETASQAPVDELFTPAPAPPLDLAALLAPDVAPAPAPGLVAPLAAAPSLAPGAVVPPAAAPPDAAVLPLDAAAPGAADSGPSDAVAARAAPGRGPCQGSDEAACSDYEEPEGDVEGGNPPPEEMVEGRARSGSLVEPDERDYPLNVVLVIVGIAAVLSVGVCALIAYGAVKRRRSVSDSSAKPLFAIGPASSGSFTQTPDSASPSTALINPRPSDAAPAPILGLTAPLDSGSARGSGGGARGMGSAGSSDIEGWAFGSVGNGTSKGPYGAPGMLRSTSLSGSVSLAHLTYPAAPGHGSSASQAGVSALDTMSSQGESAGLGGASGAAAGLQTATSGASSPERKLSDGAAPGTGGSASGSGGSNAVPAAAGGFSTASPRRVYQPPPGTAVPPKDAPHVLGTVFEGSDSHEIRDSMSHSVALDLSAGPAAGSAFATTELLVAASPSADRDTDSSAQRLAATGAISEEELEQAGRPRPLTAILSEMTAGIDEAGEEEGVAGDSGSGGGWARGESVEPPQSDEAPGPLPVAAPADVSRSRTPSPSTASASIQLPGFPAPTPARDKSSWADGAAGRPGAPTAQP